MQSHSGGRPPSRRSVLPGALLDPIPVREPVWVRLTPQAPGDPFSHTFGVLMDYDDPTRILAYSYDWTAAARFPLGAGESRRYVWDGELPQGTFGIRGHFNSDTAPRLVLQVGP